MSKQYDLVIRGGLVVDGTGEEPFVADVAVKDGRIAFVGPDAGAGAEEIDAGGRIVTPGFVDVHTHYDGQAIWSNRLSPSSSHGVTTVVAGNCGVGFAPCRTEDHARLISVMEGVEDIPGVVMADGLPWDWETFPEYLDALDARARDIDIAVYLPHSPLRVYVMGERGAQREPATGEDLAKMRSLVREAVEAGALGVATSRVLFHRTSAGDMIPSYDAGYSEIDALTGGLADAGSGIFQIVLDLPQQGWRETLEPLVATVAQSGRPATFTLGAGNDGPPTWREALDTVSEANAKGHPISAQVLPRPVGLLAGLDLSINPFCLCPSFAAIANLPHDEKLAALRDPAVRSRLLTETPEEGHPLAMISRRWEWMFPFAGTPRYDPSPESSIAAIAKARGLSPEEVAYDCLLEDDGHAFLFNALGNFHEGRMDAIHEMLSHPHAILGLGDGGAHYGSICDASYPTFFLTYWMRDNEGSGFSLPRAIRMLSHDPARAVGLLDRGLLRPGYKADLNVIDLDRLTLHMPVIRNDLPAGGRRLDQEATGYVATIVSGTVIRRDDTPGADLPGRLVRGAKAAPQTADAAQAVPA